MIWIRLWMVAYKSLKTKEKSSWVIPKVVVVTSGSGRLWELFSTKFNSKFKRGFTKVVVTLELATYKSGPKESFIYYEVKVIITMILTRWWTQETNEINVQLRRLNGKTVEGGCLQELQKGLVNNTSHWE